MEWTPKYIKTVVDNKPRDRIDAAYWNSLWNSLIEQGNHNAEGISTLIELVNSLKTDIAEVKNEE